MSTTLTPDFEMAKSMWEHMGEYRAEDTGYSYLENEDKKRKEWISNGLITKEQQKRILTKTNKEFFIPAALPYMLPIFEQKGKKNLLFIEDPLLVDWFLLCLDELGESIDDYGIYFLSTIDTIDWPDYINFIKLSTTNYQPLEEIFSVNKFNAILGNPPYNTGEGSDNSSKALYNHIVSDSISLKPKVMSMVIPARWFSGGKGLNDFRDQMLNDDQIREIHDFPNANDVFPDANIEGGVCYLTWVRDTKGDCKIVSYDDDLLPTTSTRPLLEPGEETFIRFSKAIPILHKIKRIAEPSIKEQVSVRKPFGLETLFRGEPESFPNSLKVYQNGGIGYVSRKKITKGVEDIDKYKVIVPYARGYSSFPDVILGKPMVSEPGSICSETYIILGKFDTEEEAKNLKSYVETRLFRFLIMLNKPTQHGTKKVYNSVPKQDFTQTWTDEKLYKKYGLTEEEIEYIESMIKEM